MVVASPTELTGVDLGEGRARLGWSYPVDPATGAVSFDVYSGTDPLDPLRRLHLSRGAALEAELSGLGSGTAYLSVVARSDEEISLPSRVLALEMAQSPGPVAVATTATGSSDRQPAGLGFPFGVAPGGGIRADRGHDLLHGRILQLLLTAPGERVNHPDYGTRLRDLVFDPANEVLVTATEFAVTQALVRYLGHQIQVDRVQVRHQGPELTVDVVYLRKADLRTERLRVGVPVVAA